MTLHLPRIAACILCLTASIGAAGATRSVAVKTVPATARTLHRTIDAYGRVEAAPDAVTTLSLPRAARIAVMAVRPNERVKKGQLLYRLETAPAAHQEYQQARAALKAAQTELARVKHLQAGQLATDAQLAAAQQAAADARSKLDALRAVGADQRNEAVRAPATGVVTMIALSQGQRAAADARVLSLASVDKLQVILGVEPEAANGVQAGMQATIRPVFGTKPPRKANVIAIAGSPDSASQRVTVVLRPLPDKGLRLGQPMAGTITLESQHAIAVPRSAVLHDQKGDYLFVVKSGKAQRVDIDPGIEAEGYVAIPRGLSAGDRVVTQGNYELNDGMAVRESGS